MSSSYNHHLASALMVLTILQASWVCLPSVSVLAQNIGQSTDKEPNLLESQSKYNGDLSFNKRADLLQRFFALEGFSFDPTNEGLVNRYSDGVIKHLEEYLKVDTDKARLNKLNALVSLDIYENELNLMRGSVNVDDDPMAKYQATIKSLGLILPGTGTDGTNYNLARQELSDCLRGQNPDLCKELLDKIIALLGTEECFTDRLASLMRHFYYHWIPLAHLMNLIEPKV